MNDPIFVNSGKVESLTEYASALLIGILSLKTLENFQLSAISKGILELEEAETAETIVWRIKQLIATYAKQLEDIKERAPIDDDIVINQFKKLIPEESK